ncbi:dTDP-4-dehydrorhamnose 3,5-epimerase family protein [Thermodesulfobacteriota bacterium]
MIKDAVVKPLKRIPDERGMIMHMLRSDDPDFEKFGEIYFTVVYPGVIKGWHCHTRQINNYTVVSGMVKIVLYDLREDSPTKGELMEIFAGEQNYVFVKIPVGVASGIKGVGTEPAIVANCATEPHTQGEDVRIDPFDEKIPYDWGLKHG